MAKGTRTVPILLVLWLFLCPLATFAQTGGAPDVTDTLTVTATVPGATTTTTTGTTGSSGSGGGYNVPTSVTLSGRAYPLSRVTVLKDGVIAVTTIAGPDARFSVTISSLSGGVYTFSVFSEDNNSLRSTPFTIPITITQGATTTISGIFLAPTIDTDKSVVKQGDFLAIFGQSVPNAEVHIEVHSDNEIRAQVNADENGAYVYNLDTSPLAYGKHDTNSKAMLKSTNEVTSSSSTIEFTVGTEDKEKIKGCPAKGDLNRDCRVNLVDFSILAYWYKKPSPPKSVDISGDGKVTIVDFSIMAYYWTG